MVSKKRPGFTHIPNEIFNDGLSFEQIGILAFFASHSLDWICKAKNIEKQFGIGKNQLSQKLGVLRKLGYLSRTAVYNSITKKKVGTQWHFHYPPLDPQYRDLEKHPKSSKWVSPKRVPIIRTPIRKGRFEASVVDDDDRF